MFQVIGQSVAAMGVMYPQMTPSWVSRINSQNTFINFSNTLLSVSALFQTCLMSCGFSKSLNWSILSIPLLLGAAKFACDHFKVDKQNVVYRALDFTQENLNRFIHVANLAMIVGLLYLGAPVFGWMGLALLMQCVVLGHSANDAEQIRRVREVAKAFDQKSPFLHYYLIHLYIEQNRKSGRIDTCPQSLLDKVMKTEISSEKEIDILTAEAEYIHNLDKEGAKKRMRTLGFVIECLHVLAAKSPERRDFNLAALGSVSRIKEQYRLIWKVANLKSGLVDPKEIDTLCSKLLEADASAEKANDLKQLLGLLDLNKTPEKQVNKLISNLLGEK